MNLNEKDQEQVLDLLGQFYDDIPLFATIMFGEENALRPKQIEFAEAFRNNDLITFRGGVGFGKTRIMAILVWWSPFCHDDIKITIFGPSDTQIKQGIWSELKSLYGKMPEPPRLCRRPQLVRSRVYDKQNDEQIFS